jgi:pilus assembly protein Flp/PilA
MDTRLSHSLHLPQAKPLSTWKKHPSRSLIMRSRIGRLIHDEQGAGAVEYGLLIALIAVALISAISALGGAVSNGFKKATGLGGSGNSSSASGIN